MLILNEKEEAEKILDNINSTRHNITTIVGLIMRYNIHCKNLEPEVARDETIKYLRSYYKGFNAADWKATIDVRMNYYKTKQLRVVDEISITQTEIDIIKNLENKTLKKVAFTYLVVSKLSYITNGTTWVNLSSDKMFILANAKCGEDKRCSVLNTLYKKGLISFSKTLQSTNVKIEYADTDGDKVYSVKNINNLGFFWEMIENEDVVYKFCEYCHSPFKPVTNNQKYCDEHSGMIKNVFKTYTCIDCGSTFEIKGRKRKRCEKCNKEHIKKYDCIRKKNTTFP